MPVVILLAAAVILGGIVVVAMGHGGELARDKVEAPATGDLRSWSDVARYRPPPALLGYHAASTEQALMIIARSIAERDAEISWLRSRLAELQPESAGRSGDVTDAAGSDDPARDGNGWASAEDDWAAAGNDRTAVAGDDRTAVAGDDRTAAAGDDRTAAAGDDRTAAAGDDRTAAAGDGASTAPSWEGGSDTEGTSLAENPVARDGLPTPGIAEDPLTREGAPTQDSASAGENRPDPEGSQAAAAAEQPVQAGYWPQAGPVTHD